MKFQRDDVFTGLFVIIGVMLGLGTLLTLLGYNVFENRTTYIIRMEKLAGVQKGTEVHLKDFKVGSVDEVIPIYGNNIFFKAKVSIDRELVLYRGAKINIVKQNVIGDTVLELFPAMNERNRLKENDTLFATNIINLSQMVSQITGLVNNISELVGEVTSIAAGSRGGIKDLLANLNSSISKIDRVISNSEGSIETTLKNIAKTSATLEKFSREIRKNPLLILGKDGKGSGSGSALP